MELVHITASIEVLSKKKLKKIGYDNDISSFSKLIRNCIEMYISEYEKKHGKVQIKQK